MKGVSVGSIRALVSAVLAKADTLLTTEPARLIGYGAGVVIFLVVQVLNARGITRFGSDLTFDQSLGLSFGAIVILTSVVESIRRFVYSPFTYVSDLAIEGEFQHEMAHAEEDFNRAMAESEQAPKPRTMTIPVGSVPQDGPKN
jgi:hypothetical protein